MGDDLRNLTIGTHMREVRESVGLSQAAVADMLMITSSYYHLVEKGKVNVSGTVLRLFCYIFDVTEDVMVSPDKIANLPVSLKRNTEPDTKRHVSESNGNPDRALKEAAERVKSIRRSLGMEQVEFASKIGISLSALRSVESGRMHLSCAAWARVDELTLGEHPLLLVDMDNDVQRMVAACAIRRTFYTVRDEETIANLKMFADATQTELLEVLVEVVIRKLAKIPKYHKGEEKGGQEQ